MIKILKNKKAQAVTGEYVLVFFLAVAAMVAMTVYVKRAYQAQFRNARMAMINIVNERTGAYYTGNVFYEYEPYYLSTDATTTRRSDQREYQTGTALSTGIYTKVLDSSTSISSIANYAPPKDVDLEFGP